MRVFGNPLAGPDEEPSRLFRFVGIVGAFVLLGPLVAGAVFWLVGNVNFAVRFGMLPTTTPSLFMFMLWAYALGAPLAFVAGIVHAVAAIWLNRSSLLLPIAATVVVAAPAIGLLATSDPFQNPGSTLVTGALAFVPPSLVASFVCWRVTRGLLRSPS